MKDINFYMNLDYPYEITPEEDGGYHAEIPLLPGCIAHAICGRAFFYSMTS